MLTLDDVTLGWYYIGVFGWQASSFTLTITLGDIALIPGRPYDDVLEAGQSRYFSFTVPSTNDDIVLLSLAYMFGDAAVYVTTSDDNPPSAENHMWDSTVVSALDLRNTLTIHPEDDKYCIGCTYYVAVAARTRTSYSVTLSFGSESVLLADGRSLNSILDDGMAQFFYAFVDSDNHDISIDVTMYACIYTIHI